MDVNSTFLNNLCRICTTVTDGISIYSKEGKEISLEEKIKKFLYISVSEEDMLPKTVCQMCTSKLDSIHEFATMAAQTQEKLVKMGSTTGSEEVGGSGSGESDGSEERWDDTRHQASPPPEEESQDQLKGSLLHSILTKEKEEDTGGDVTEMEVRVDPMLYLTDLDEEEGDKGSPGVQPISGLSHSAPFTTHHPHEEDYGEGQSLDCKPYQCSICPRGFNTDLSLKNHLWSHISMRKILASSDLNLNRFRVEGASQCLCTVCGRVYPTRSTLRAHQITHSNLRPHKCSLCEKTFKRNQDLKFHINQHTGERPYRCPYCPKAFASSGNCFSHRKRMHPKQLARDKKARQLHH